VGHQANLRMLENVCRRCEIPPERHHANVEWYGNTADIAVVGVGAGLTWAGYLLRFGPET
jgi:3-oxoacyl-[acyl-carrier-protein] synthase-3